MNIQNTTDYREDLSVRNRRFLKAKAILQPISLYFKKFLKAKAIWHPIFLYFMKSLGRRRFCGRFSYISRNPKAIRRPISLYFKKKGIAFVRAVSY